MFRSIARHRPQVLPLAGPPALVGVIATWTLVLVVGWACIYWPHLSEGFLLASGLEPGANEGFPDALYLSLVTLGTLGYGEITPLTAWLRVVGPLEGLVGFALFTASISWILSVYPVLARRRHLAREVTLLQRAGVPDRFDGAASLEAVHAALMRDDWSLVPALFRTAQRTVGVVRLNIGFTAAYNVIGITLAAFGFLPPIFAAAAQWLPDLGILGNSARLLRNSRRDA